MCFGNVGFDLKSSPKIYERIPRECKRTVRLTSDPITISWQVKIWSFSASKLKCFCSLKTIQIKCLGHRLGRCIYRRLLHHRVRHQVRMLAKETQFLRQPNELGKLLIN